MITRLFDIAVAIVGLIIFVVTYPLIALAIKLDSRGPVIYSQTRVGLRGKRFTMYKYRSMSHEGHKPYETPKLEPVHFKTFVFTTPMSRLTRVGALPARHQPGRAAELLERAEGRHERRRPAPGDPGAGRAVPARVPPPPRREARHHRPRADQRPRRPLLRRDDAVRHRVRERPLVRRRPEDRLAHAGDGDHRARARASRSVSRVTLPASRLQPASPHPLSCTP